MCLFNLVEKYNGVRFSSYLFGKLTALVIADISGRCANQTRYAEFLHVFAHVDTHHVLLVIKQRLRKGFCQLGLADAGRAKEQEAAQRTVRVLDARTGAQDSFAHALDSFILPNDALMQRVLKVEQLLALAFHQLRHRDARPAADDSGDFLLRHLVAQQAVLALGLLSDGFLRRQFLLELRQLAVLQFCRLVQVVLTLGAFHFSVHALDFLAQLVHLRDGVLFAFPLRLHLVELVALLRQLLLHLCQTRLGQLVVVLLQRRFLNFQLHDVAVDVVHFCRHGVDFGTNHGTRFIHKVNRLVGQEAVGDIAVGERCGGNQGVVLNLHAVEHFVALLEAAQDGNRVLNGRLAHHDRLETTLQSGVLLDILAVFIQRRRTDAVQLAARQHRLQEVAGVHCAVRLACADNRVQLINEQQDAPFAALDFRKHRLQALLELAAELCAGNQAAHIQRENGLVLQRIRHVAAHDSLRQPFGDSGLADARFANQHRVILRLPAQNTDDVADFAVTADNRIELVLPRHLHKVRAVLLQRIVRFLRVVGGHTGCAADGRKLLQELLLVVAHAGQNFLDVGVRLRRDAEENMLNGEVLVLHLLGAVFRLQQGFLEVRGNINLVCLAAGAGHARNPRKRIIQRRTESIYADAAPGQQLRDERLRIFRQGEQHMLLIHLHVLIFHRDLLGALESFHRFLGELVRVHNQTSFRGFDFL